MSDSIIQQKTKIIQELRYDFVITTMNFGEWLKLAREELNVSGVDLEKRTKKLGKKVSRQYISNLEKGAKTDKNGNLIQASREVIEVICKALGVDVIGIGDFAITNFNGKTVLSFRAPSMECIDYVRQHNKIVLAGVKPNDPCPCNSGRKFKKCHGGSG